MNASLVIDASVAVKILVQEDLSAQADDLLRDAGANKDRLFAPPYFLGEVCNAIYQRWRTTDSAKQLTDAEAARALARALAWPVEISTPPGLCERAFAFAQLAALPSLYDSLYVVLAQMLGAELWTADARLLAAVGAHAPWVRSLADYQP